MIKKLILINLIILTLLSCKKDEEEAPIVIPPIGSSEIFEFFKVGNRWEYQKYQKYQDGEHTHILTDTAYYTNKEDGEDSVLFLRRHWSTGLDVTVKEKIEDGVYYRLDGSVFLPRGFIYPDINYQQKVATVGDSLLITILNTDTIYNRFGLNINCYTIKYFPLRTDYENDNWAERILLVNNKIGVVSNTFIGHNVVVPGDITYFVKDLMNYSFVEE